MTVWLKEAGVVALLLSLLVLAAGLYFTVGTGVCQRNCLPLSLQALKSRETGGVSPFEALGAALSGTMGVGSLLAVSTALQLGGPGAILWMWIGGFASMALKYAEVYLCVRHRRAGRGELCGGAMVVLRDVCKKPVLAGAYALFTAAACLFSIGGMSQAAAVSSVLRENTGLPALACAALLVLLLLPLPALRPSRLGKLCGTVFPAMALLYVCGCLLCLFLQRHALSQALRSIFVQGLSPSAFLSGGGFTALRYGVARGLFSNEAGLGTSAMAHSLSAARDPRRQAGLGMAEVFVNTHLICSLTALVLLCAPAGVSDADGAAAVLRAFGAILGRGGEMLVSMMILFFGLSTMPVWLLYGKRAASFLFPLLSQKAVFAAFVFLYLVCAFLGALVEQGDLWKAADLLNLGLAVPNLFMLFLLRREVFDSVLKKTGDLKRK